MQNRAFVLPPKNPLYWWNHFRNALPSLRWVQRRRNGACRSGVAAECGPAHQPVMLTLWYADLDGSGPATDYSATIDWSDGTRSAGTIVANGNGSFSVIFEQHAYAEEGIPSHLG